MRVLRLVLQAIATLAVLMGLLWIGQGTGVVMWPRESFMLAEPQWAVNGAVLLGLGVALLWVSRRRG